MNQQQAQKFLNDVLSEIIDRNGAAATDKYCNLRSVDAKVREVKFVLSSTPGIPQKFLVEIDNDDDFSANSRRVRLEALANYCTTAIRFLNSGGFNQDKFSPTSAPDISIITANIPNLKNTIERRWIEAQKCQNAECYTAAIIMMGSILEALLLCRANLDPSDAYRSSKAPKDKHGKTPAIQDWTLNTLIEVAVDLNWLKTDRGKFSHALRESRNIVHPWVEVMTKANFDIATCKTSWIVLKASVSDLMKSI